MNRNRCPVKLLSLREDGAELMAAFGSGLYVLLLPLHFDWVRTWCAVIVFALAMLRIVTEMIGRAILRAQFRFMTKHGLIVVGRAAPSVQYIEQVIDDTFEWLVDNKCVKAEDAARMLAGCVLEVVDVHTPAWCLDPCPWPLLPWERFGWIRTGVDSGRLPALPHEVFHRAMLVCHGWEDVDTVHEAIDDVGFTETG